MKQLKTITYGIFITMLIISLQTQAQNKPKKQNNEITEYEDVRTEPVEDKKIYFQFIDNPPVYPGCENLKGREAKKCMSDKINNFVSENFNLDIAYKLDIEGKVKIMNQFTIDTEGKVTNIKSRSKYKELAAEAKRIIGLLPQMEPGKVRNRKIKVTYTLPIVFNIEVEETQTNDAVLKSCKDKESAFAKRKCSENKLDELIVKNIDLKKLEDLHLKGHKIFAVDLSIDKNGKITNIVSKSSHPKLNEELAKTVNKLPEMIPATKDGVAVKSTYHMLIFINFGHNKNEIKLEKELDDNVIYGIKNDEQIDFRFVSKAPVYPGCENMDNINSKKCMSKKIYQLIGENFNRNIASKLKLKGKIKIISAFTIDKKGEITNISTKTKYKELAEETKRVIKLIPKMKPGRVDGKPVNVRYTLPIVFIIDK